MTQTIQEELRDCVGEGDYQLPQFFEKPIELGRDFYTKITDQLVTVSEFYDTSAYVARKAIKDKNNEIIRLLFSDFLGGMTVDYHSNLPEKCWNRPVFYRTDQSISGKIYELQAPGSGWGDLALLAKAFDNLGYVLPDRVKSIVEQYCNTIKEVTHNTMPRVLHMLDAASEPAGMRYLCAKSRPMLKYWGLDKDVHMHEVDYVTAHSAAELVTCNFFNEYVKLQNEGKLVFGVQPNLLYDQKAIYLLPFHRRTRDFYTEEVRDLFPFTTVLENGGFFDKSDSFVTIDEFSFLPRSKRNYYLKYGGTDLSRNWGSRAVFRLDTMSKESCAEMLHKVNLLSNNGEIWLIQEDATAEDKKHEFFDIKEISKNRMHVKLSAFSSCARVYGVKIMARQHFKVHGQTDTFVGLGI